MKHLINYDLYLLSFVVQFVKTEKKKIWSHYHFLDIFAKKSFVKMDFLSLLNVRIGNVEPFWRTFQVFFIS